MDKDGKVIAWFEEVGKDDIASVGGKGANLGEMTKAGIPVPPGFIVTAAAYFDFLKKTEITERIRDLLQPLDTNDSRALQDIASQVKHLINSTPMLPEIAREIARAYIKLGNNLVAVRSSATLEDLPEASFAGQQRTYLNVQGEAEVIAAVQGCWASLFEPRAIFYRDQHGFDHFKVGIAVPVQKMVQSDASGVMFTLEPVSNDQSKIVIEAVYGLGEAIVSGEVSPDLYVVDKEKLKFIDKKIGKQQWQLVRNPVGLGRRAEPNIKVALHPPEQALQKLADDEIIELARLGKHIEQHYQFPQDIEWAKEKGKIYVVQTRPVTTLKPISEEAVTPLETTAPVLLTGMAASPGVAAGPVKIVPNPSDIYKVESGDILVTEMTTPDYVPAMKRAVAIVTDKGGRTTHAAIVSRELGIPCVVGTEKATRILRDGQQITVDGSQGKVYQGIVIKEKAKVPIILSHEHIRTDTRVYVNLAQPERAQEVAAMDVDGVGLLRAEFMVAQVGEHPSHMISQNRGHEFVDQLAQGIAIFARAFDPRPVVYRTTDFKTNEYKNLRGGAEYEEDEENPMLGYRGCARYIRDIEVFKLEIEAIKRVRESYKNLWVMIPFVRTVDEMAQVKHIMELHGLYQTPDFKLWMMVEVPSNIFLLEKFIQVGIDGISIGSNDLTQLILGIDRDSRKLAEKFDERNEAVLIALEKAVRTSASLGITCSICGDAPSTYPELTAKLVEWGITSVSVSPDMIDRTRAIIAVAEGRLAGPSRVRRLVRAQA